MVGTVIRPVVSVNVDVTPGRVHLTFKSADGHDNGGLAFDAKEALDLAAEIRAKAAEAAALEAGNHVMRK